jgi:plastocyanin
MNGPAVGRSGRTVALLVAAVAIALSGCGGGAVAADTPSSGNPPGPYVVLAARDIAFDTGELLAPANTAFTIVFDNREAVPHNVAMDRLQGGQASRVFNGAVFSGPATRWYAVPALAPGEYTFLCQVHPSMTGRLVAA